MNKENNVTFSKQVGFRGKQDEKKLREFFNCVNKEVALYKIPANLYTHTSSPLDFAVYDFKYFNFDSINKGSGIGFLSITNKNGRNNEMIIHPNTLIFITFEIGVTLEPPKYDFLAINIYAKRD
ncbi:MAG: hypothetical protein PHY90_10305 [Desulfitobacteriaceae bacterium]|nr:hypothetical protein [Desulfitobacteriaceae bacterium]